MFAYEKKLPNIDSCIKRRHNLMFILWWENLDQKGIDPSFFLETYPVNSWSFLQSKSLYF